MKKYSTLIVGTIIFLFVTIIGVAFYRFNFTNDDIYISNGGKINSKDTSYLVDGKQITLKDGFYEEASAPGSASKDTYSYFGNDATGDFNADGKNDSAFLLTKQSGGSGVFYYVVVKLSKGEAFEGTNAVLLGDRIAPQTTEFRGGQIIVNFADRKVGEPFTVAPSVGVSKYFKVTDNKLVEVTTK